jgi:drug/metabolite transporter (DMT)-like permease
VETTRPHSLHLVTTIPARSPTAAGALLAGGAIGAVGFSVAVSDLLTGAPFLASQAARYALGAAVLLAVALARRQRLPHPDLADLGRVAALAATGMIGFNLCLVAALRRAEPGAVGVIVGCVPLLLALGGPLLERRAPARRVVAGAVLAVLGAAVVEGGGSASPAGVGLAAGALLGEAAFSLLAVPLLVRWGPLVLSLYACLAGTVMLAVASPLVEWPALRPPTAAETAAVVFLGVVVTAGGFFCWYAGVARLGVERAGLLAGLLPVAALAGGAVLGSGAVGPAQVVGTALVAVGISAGMVSGRRPRPAPIRTPAG